MFEGFVQIHMMQVSASETWDEYMVQSAGFFLFCFSLFYFILFFFIIFRISLVLA